MLAWETCFIQVTNSLADGVVAKFKYDGDPDGISKMYVSYDWTGEVGPGNGEWFLPEEGAEFDIPAGDAKTSLYMINMGDVDGTIDMTWQGAKTLVTTGALLFLAVLY